MNRSEVYRLIDKEREYQGKFPKDLDDKHSKNDWVAHIVQYLGKSVNSEKDHTQFRKHMVKVAALAVAVLEREHYAPRHYEK